MSGGNVGIASLEGAADGRRPCAPPADTDVDFDFGAALATPGSAPKSKSTSVSAGGGPSSPSGGVADGATGMTGAADGAAVDGTGGREDEGV